MPRNLAFSVLCLVSSFEALSKCCAKAGKECQTAGTALKDEATQRIVNTLPILLRVVCKSWEHWSSSRCSLVTGCTANINVQEMTESHLYHR